MKIFREFLYENYEDKYIDPNSQLGKFIIQLNSLVNKEQDFINFISKIKFWSLPSISLWSIEQILNYIDTLLNNYSNNLSEETTKNKLKTLLKFLLLLIKNGRNIYIFSSLDNLETIFLKSFDIQTKIVILKIYRLYINDNKSIYEYAFKIPDIRYIFMNMRKIFMNFIDNSYQLNSKIISDLEQILLKQDKKWKNKITQIKDISSTQTQKEINPFLIFREIINNNKDYENKDDFLTIKNVFEYFACNPIYNKDNLNNNISLYEREYLLSINNFFCILNFLKKINDKKTDINKIHLLFEFNFELINLCFRTVTNFENDIVTDEYKEYFIKDIIYVFTKINNIKIKIGFLNHYLNLSNLNNGYGYILFQNGLFQSVLFDMAHQNDNNLSILTKEESLNQILFKYIIECYIQKMKILPKSIQESLLEPPKNNIYLYSLDNVLFYLDMNIQNDENIIYQVLIPRIIYELEHLNSPESENKYIFNKEIDKEMEFPNIIARVKLINKIFNILYKYIQKVTNIENMNKLDSAITESIKSLINNNEMKKNNNLYSVYINGIYLLLKICNAYPSKISGFISNGIIQLIFDYLSNYLPKTDGIFYLLFFAMYSISTYDKGREYIIENNRGINMINNIFNKIKKDQDYFYYKLYYLEDMTMDEFSLWVGLLNNNEMKNIINCFFDNYISLLNIVKKEFDSIKIEFNESLTFNSKEYLLINKLKFIFQPLYSIDNSNYQNYNNYILYDDKIKKLSNSFKDLLIMPNYLLLNTFLPNYIELIIETRKNPSQDLKIFNKYNDLIKKTNSLNLHKNQKIKILKDYQKIIEFHFSIYLEKDFGKKSFEYTFFTIISKLIIKNINDNSNINSFFWNYDGKLIIINNDINIHILSKNIEPEIKKIISEELNNYYIKNKRKSNFIILNEDNYLEIKSKPRFDIQLKCEYVEYINSQVFKEYFAKYMNNKSKFSDIFNYMKIFGEKKITTDLDLFLKEDFETMKNYINVSYLICLILKYYRKVTLGNITPDIETKNLILNLNKLLDILNFVEDIITGKNSFNFFSIIYFYIIKFGGVRQLFKIAFKLIQICQNESKKNEIPLIEIIIINNIWDKLNKLILFFSREFSINNDTDLILLISESEIAKKLIYTNEINAYTKYMILKDLKEIFFKGDEDDIEKNKQFFSDLEIYSIQMYRIILFIIDDFLKYSKRINNKTNYNKIYEKGYKVYEVMIYVQQGIQNENDILKNLESSNKTKNKNRRKKREEINDFLLKIEEYNPYPEPAFITNMKNSLDENQEIFKSQKDKENKNVNIKYIDYNFEKFTNIIDYIMNLINKADISKNMINNLRRNNLYFRTILNDDTNKIQILENSLKRLNNNESNILLNKKNKLEQELVIKMRINYNIIKYHQIVNIYMDNKIDIYNFIKKNNIIQKYIDSIRNLINETKIGSFNQNKINQLVYENIVTIYLCFKYIHTIKKDFENEKKLFLDIFLELLIYESENINLDKSIISENILIMLLININKFCNNETLLFPYLQKGLANKIINLKFKKEITYKTFYENNFKSKVVLSECFQQFMLIIFSNEKILQNLIESIILYGWANIKTNNSYKCIYLEDFIYFCGDYSQKYQEAFKNALIKIFNIEEVEIKGRSIRNSFNNNIKIKNLLKLKPEYEEKIKNIKNNISNYRYNEYLDQEKKITCNNKIKNVKQISHIIPDINKSVFTEILKHIFICAIKIEKNIEKNKDNQINSKKYMIDLDTSLISLSNILHSFPCYISLILLFQKGKKNKISFITFLIKNIFPLLNHFPCYNNEEFNTTKTMEESYYNMSNNDKGILKTFRRINIIKYLIQTITYKRRNMNEDEIFLVEKCRKKIIYIINKSLKEISLRIINDINNIKNMQNKENKNIILYKSHIFVLLSMTEFFKNSDLYSQYNPFEITKIILNSGCDIIKNINHILKNMNICNDNQIYHEIGIIYLQKLLNYIPINIRMETNNSDLKINEEKIKNNINSNLNNENIENFENNKVKGELNCNKNIIIDNSHDNRDSENNNDSREYYENSSDNRFEDEENQENDENNEMEEDCQVQINENNINNENDLNIFCINNENIFNLEDNFNSIEENINIINFIDRDSINPMNDEQINNEDDNLYDEEFEDPEEFEDNDSFIDNDEDMELDIPLSFPRFYFLHDDYSDPEYHSNMSENDENIEDSFARVFDKGYFNKYLINNNDDMILFQDQFIKINNNNSIQDILKEDSLNFIFSFYQNRINNNLILFHSSNFEIKCFEKRRKLEKFEKSSNSFIYRYIFPIEDSDKLLKFFNLIVLGSTDSSINYYKKWINKIKNDYYNFCFDNEKNIINENILKEVRNNILKQGNIIKLKKKEKNIKMINFIDKKENKEKDKGKLNDKIKRDCINDFKMSFDLDKIYSSRTPRYSYNSSDYLFYPFIHFDDFRNDINQNTETKSEKNEKEKEKEKINNKEEIDEKDKNSEENKKENLENINEKNNNTLINTENEVKNNDNKEEDKDKYNINKTEEKINVDEQFILEIPKELREEVLLNISPELIPNLSNELQSEYHRLIMKENKKNKSSPSQNNSFHFEPSENKLKQKEENPEPEYFNEDEFLYKDIELVNHSYTEEDILFNLKYSKKNIYRLLQSLDDEFIDNLLLYNIKNIILKKKLIKNEYNIRDSNPYFELICKLILNVNLRYKIIDLLFILLICNFQSIIEVINIKENLEKNILLKKLNYLYSEKNSNENILIEYYKQLLLYIIENNEKEMKNLFIDFTFKDNGTLLASKNKKEYSITKNSKYIKNILGIKYDKNQNVISNLLNIIFSLKLNYVEMIYQIKIFTDIINNCKNASNFENNNFLVFTFKKNSKNENFTLNINQNTIEKLVEIFDDFRINLDSKNKLSNNNPTSLLIELITGINDYQLIYDKIINRLLSLKNEIIEDMNNSGLNSGINKYNKRFPEFILLSIIKFTGILINNIYTKNKTKWKRLNEKGNNTIKNFLVNFKNFLGKISEILFPCWDQLNNILNEINAKKNYNEKTIQHNSLILLPFFQSFIILSYIYIGFNAKDNTNNSSEFIIEKKYIANHKSPLRNDILSFSDSSFINYFYKLCEDNKKIINKIFKNYPKKFPRGLFMIISKILDLENKREYFNQELKKLPYKNEYLRIKVRRKGMDLYMDSYNSLASKTGEQLRSRLIVTFNEEEAVDAGGVKREWLTILSKEMFNPNYMLFDMAKNGTTYTINSDSGKYNPNHLREFEFIGKIMAKAIYDGMMIDCYFTRIIYKFITNTPISYHDMEDYDPQFYKSIKILLENDYTGKDTYLTYSYNHDICGEMKIVDLIENGRNIDVTESNKFDYVQRLCSAKLYDTIKPQVGALLKGFYEIIPQKLISIFNYRELERVISGLPTIDIKDWKRNTMYSNYNENTPVIKYFWEIIESYDNDERAEFLQFVTGSSKVPLEGFCALQGIGGVNKFLIAKVFDKNFDRLPTAHTCTNQLDLPEYPSKEILKQRLKFAIKEGKGFGFI